MAIARFLGISDAADAGRSLSAEGIPRRKHARQVGLICTALDGNSAAGNAHAPGRRLLGSGPAHGDYYGIVLRPKFRERDIAADPRIQSRGNAQTQDLGDLALEHFAGQLLDRDFAAEHAAQRSRVIIDRAGMAALGQ